MVYQCCVPTCNTRSECEEARKISVFKLPKDTETKRKWQTELGKIGICTTKSSHVCEKHFAIEQIKCQMEIKDKSGNIIFKKLYKQKHLVNGAVPKLLKYNVISEKWLPLKKCDNQPRNVPYSQPMNVEDIKDPEVNTTRRLKRRSMPSRNLPVQPSDKPQKRKKRSSNAVTSTNIECSRFPKDENKKKERLQLLNMDNDSDSTRISSLHFKSTDYAPHVLEGGKQYLKRSALASLPDSQEGMELIVESSVQNGQETSFETIYIITDEEECEVNVKTENDLGETEVETENDISEIKVEIENDLGEIKVENESDLSEIKVDIENNELSEIKVEYENDFSEIKVETENDNRQDVLEDPAINARKLLSSEIEAENEEELPFKNVRRLGDINVDEVSKSPEESKLCLEVAVDIISELKAKVKSLQTERNKLKEKVTNLKPLKGRSRYDKLISDLTDDNSHVEIEESLESMQHSSQESLEATCITLKRPFDESEKDEEPQLRSTTLDDINIDEVMKSSEESKFYLEIALSTVKELRTKIKYLQNLRNKLKKKVAN